jgi:LysM repeat protein
MAVRSRARRSHARYLAPVALAATIAGTYVIVHNTLNATKSTSITQSATRPQTKSVPHHRAAGVTRFYVVKAGDNLSSIAAKTGVALTTIESLNHNLDPNALQTGQRLRLRR